MSHRGPIAEEDQQPSLWNTIWTSIVSGGASAITEVGFDHPAWTLKNRCQDEAIPKTQKFTLDPRILYKGVIANLLSMVPITALQVSTAQSLKAVRHDVENPPTQMEALAYNATGGAVSALISGPTELGMIQQTQERGFIATIKHICSVNGIKGLARGMFGSAGRDAIFTMGYGYIAPQRKKKHMENGSSELGATVMGGIEAGVPTGILSHPLDTLKTIQQTASIIDPVTPIWKLAKDKYQKEGVKSFYKGVGWRSLRVVSGVTIMSTVSEKVSSMLQNRNRF